jgi:Methyltransferase domain
MRAANSFFKLILRRLFEVGQRVGINILPKHFYSQIPDIQSLRGSQYWRQSSSMFGVGGIDLQRQVSFLQDLCPPTVVAEWQTLDVHAAASRENGQGGGYGVVEANILHAFICRQRPKRIVQIGCGVSTSIILRAASMMKYRPELVCIEPFPSPFLLESEAAGLIVLIQEPAQTVSRDVLTSLASGDLLFVDSTHTVKPGSEVNRIILEVLPRLVAGVFVHFHDIYFPYDYQRELLSHELFFCSESTLLHAFLIGNSRYEIALSLSMLHHARPESITAAVPFYDPQGNLDGLSTTVGQHFPSAIYLAVQPPAGAKV